MSQEENKVDPINDSMADLSLSFQDYENSLRYKEANF